MKRTKTVCQREYDFALIVVGQNELTDEILNALFEAGCDDATVSLQYGFIYMEFSRSANSMKDAILSAIRNVRKAKVGLNVWRVDDCNLVTQAEIARRIGRTRQLVQQYMAGTRGPGGFPAPQCNLKDRVPLWTWCSVSYWLVQNDMIRPEELQNAEAINAINNMLEHFQQKTRNPGLLAEIAEAVSA